MIFHSIFHVGHVNVITFSFYKTNNITIIDETNKICREKLWLNATNIERQYIERHLVSMRYRGNSCNRIMLRHVPCPTTILEPNQITQTSVCVCVCVTKLSGTYLVFVLCLTWMYVTVLQYSNVSLSYTLISCSIKTGNTIGKCTIWWKVYRRSFSLD